MGEKKYKDRLSFKFREGIDEKTKRDVMDEVRTIKDVSRVTPSTAHDNTYLVYLSDQREICAVGRLIASFNEVHSTLITPVAYLKLRDDIAAKQKGTMPQP
ncbi:MAG: hypothetical protein H6867_10175 [Rhodospirillales bacterium]|nr:hypothetical protein [Rhodospirillales bacterium]MCB9995850.1 hypothetical protein [Rhodospirillales bacterium]